VLAPGLAVYGDAGEDDVNLILQEREPVQQERVVLEAGDGGIPVVPVRVDGHDRLAPGLAVVRGAHGQDAPAPGPPGVRGGDVAVAGVEDAEKVAVAQAANVREGGVAPCRLAGANDLVLGRGGGRQQQGQGQGPRHSSESHRTPSSTYSPFPVPARMPARALSSISMRARPDRNGSGISDSPQNAPANWPQIVPVVSASSPRFHAVLCFFQAGQSSTSRVSPLSSLIA